MASFDFYFTRLMYDSGDWDVDVRMPSNVLNSLVEYTTLRVDPAERMVALSDPKMLRGAVLLPGRPQAGAVHAGRAASNFERYVRGGGFVFVDDCNHDIDGLFAKSFEAEMARIFGPKALHKIPNNHPLYSSFFKFDGPPNTGVRAQRLGRRPGARLPEGDRDRRPRAACCTRNKDYGCEWDYDFRNKRFLAVDNTRFAVNIIQYALGA